MWRKPFTTLLSVHPSKTRSQSRLLRPTAKSPTANSPAASARHRRLAIGLLIACGWTMPAFSQDKPIRAIQQQVATAAAEVVDVLAGENEQALENDPIKRLQANATTTASAEWGYWGTDPRRYSTWTNHSNRLIPVYTFGITLEPVSQQSSPYRSIARLKEIYGELPEGSHNPDAEYLDQTDIYQLQLEALNAGKKNIILMVFDGMDWQTTQAAAIYKTGKVAYTEGRGTGLHFLDYNKAKTDYGSFVTSPHRSDADVDVDAQLVTSGKGELTGGYDWRLGGSTPWDKAPSRDYLLGLDRNMPHAVTDSASSATSMTAGIKTYNAGINVSADGKQVEPIARMLQSKRKYSIGVISSVPISHATPAAAYANNVSRNDYQDLSRDLVGLPSAAHRDKPLEGADVVLGAGWGEDSDGDRKQGNNFVPGNKYLPIADVEKISTSNGGKYVVATRSAGQSGKVVLKKAADAAIEENKRLFGFFGAKGGHLPYQTADGNYDPTLDVTGRESYTKADVDENPTLADLTEQALRVLEKDEDGFWLMIEAGDVDWANHANNLDNSIGAVLSGDAAFKAVVDWVENNSSWEDTVVILTADHGHYLNITTPEVLAEQKKQLPTAQ